MRTRRQGTLWVEKQVRQARISEMGVEGSKSSTAIRAMEGRVAIPIGVGSGIKTNCRIKYTQKKKITAGENGSGNRRGSCRGSELVRSELMTWATMARLAMWALGHPVATSQPPTTGGSTISPTTGIAGSPTSTTSRARSPSPPVPPTTSRAFSGPVKQSLPPPREHFPVR
ncbi:hypothetical protein TIFTF001_037683 [Ficus carica]|uniref:Uncharacterized protein n=1 Tax=Ficus carica TaxID=3494 RepID=A0AA88E6P1_FICCA|nr:hypothetical protein TIFTF001_037683 [Ficus carica]